MHRDANLSFPGNRLNRSDLAKKISSGFPAPVVSYGPKGELFPMQKPVFPENGLQRLSFGIFEVDVKARELRKQGLRVKLQEKPFQLLAALLERPGEVVTREDLRKKLWGEQTFVDFERSLNIAITKLRAAICDSAGSPRFIETLPRRGYRFIAPVTAGAVERSTESLLQPAPTNDVPQPRPASNAAYLKQIVFHRSFLIAVLSLTALTAISFALNISGLKDRAFGKSAPFHPGSIAVLPLENYSGDSEQEYLADGITDALITDLGTLSTLRVISRTSMMAYKGTRKSLPEIARELKADAIVEGAVMHFGDHVRITAQLLDAHSDRHLWAKAFERDDHDVLALQNDLAAGIAAEIQRTVNPRQPRLVDPEVWTLCLKGRYFWAKKTVDDLKKGLQYFQQAIDKDPQYAPAYAGLADSYLFLAFAGVPPKSEMVAKARDAASKALQLDEELAEAHTSIAAIKCTFEGDWAGAEREYRRSIDLNPNYAIAHQWWASTLAAVGRQAEALAEIKRAKEIDPLSLQISTTAGLILYYGRQYPQATEQYKQVLELDPNFALAHTRLGEVYMAQGMKEQALGELEAGVSLSSRQPGSLAALGYAYGVFGNRKAALKILAELENRSDSSNQQELNRGMLYLGLRDYDQALRLFQLAKEHKTAALGNLRTDPEFDPVRSDPRFIELLRRIQLAS
jgi:TolB-like protein/DNA-binding winged helix-turn-helix (wHTH) protein/Tfp pilus assembly protein PilF